MARPARSDSEKRQCGMRSAALLHTLASRAGAQNPHQFASYLDGRIGMQTQQSGKWRLNFSGERPLSLQQRKLLARLDAEVESLYENGPADLWIALWGNARDLWQLCRTRTSSLGSSMDDRDWAEISCQPVGERTFDIALAEFEGETLLIEAYGEPFTLRHLSEAVTLYRLHQALAELALLDIDGQGICRCIRMCVDDAAVRSELTQLGVLEGVLLELASALNRQDVHASTTQRWDKLKSKLEWVS
ncbi:hypothetical protein KDW10_24965 [Burkholderia vietnamiensis]|nr:hypothetical protein [Burkholderia vietnamiensis]